MWWKSFFKKLSDIILDLFFPKHCIMCDKTVMEFTDIALCGKCLKKKPVPKCIRDDRFIFNEAVCALEYKDAVKDTMLRYKFKSIKYYSKAFAFVMAEAANDRPYFKDALICPVPLSKGRERAYNQTAVIAEEISRKWDSEYIEDLLLKCRELKPLSKMKLNERRFYIEGAFTLNPEYSIFGRDILLIDDIFTSGTTAKECAKILKMYGAHNVYVLCACYD